MEEGIRGKGERDLSADGRAEPEEQGDRDSSETMNEDRTGLENGRRSGSKESVRTTGTGTRIFLRPVQKEDEQLLRSFVEVLSEDALYHRFFRRVRPAGDLLHRLVDIDETKQAAILALINHGNNEEIVGVGRYFVEPRGDSAEIVITVRDDHQNNGIGRELLSHLISLARAQGLKGLTAQVLADNVPMLRLLRSLEGTEYDIRRRLDAGVFHFEMRLT